MTDKIILESDLVGVRPWLMGQILFFVMMVLPLGTIPVEYSPMLTVDWWLGGWSYSAMPYSILWKLSPYDLFPSFNTLWLDPAFLLLAIPVLVLNIIFVVEVVRYYKALVSQKHVIIVGALSFLIPFMSTALTRVIGVLPDSGAYFGPLPFLLIIGLLMLYKIPGPELVVPDVKSAILRELDMEEVH